MSTDVSMASDDDAQLHNGNGPSHVATNGSSNGHSAPTDDGEDSPMSEDDAPLSQTIRTKSAQPTPKARPPKRKKAVVPQSSSEEDDDDDVPLSKTPMKAAKPKTAAVPMHGALAATTVPTSNGRSKARASTSKPIVPPSSDGASSDDDDDDAPLAQTKKSANGKAKGLPKKTKVKKEESDAELSDEDGDDVPLGKRAKAPVRKKRKVKEENDASDDDKPLSKKTPAAKVKKASAKKVKKEEDIDELDSASGSDNPAPVKKGKAVKKETKDKKVKAKKEEEEEDVYRWWEQDAGGDGSEKWQTLEHSGVYFPPPYEPLPKSVKMKYDGKAVDLPPASEEVAGFYAVLIETDHAKDATFNKNFFNDWLDVLKRHPPRDGTKITSLDRCDFRPMFEHFEAEKARKKTLTTAEKKEIKAAKDKLEEPYATCLLDGRREKVGNFRVEPPSLFRGRGEHPKKGSLKLRVNPEDITINIGEGVPIPKPNVPGTWKSVIHDKTVTWLATWTENVNGNNKYVFLAAGSSLKGQSDMAKFQKARDLKSHVDRIRQDYLADLGSKIMVDRQRATAMYFIDRLALRAGNEKGEDEADTVGCCSLRCEHVTLEPPNFIIFDFLGKDSIRYYNRVAVDTQVFKSIRIFKKDKDDSDPLFDRVTTTTLNKHLTSYMKGLTAKVFRTYNASITFQEQLDKNTPKGASMQELLNAYNKANRMVAILCNHQRSVPKTHETSMGKMRDKIKGLKYERMKLRHVLMTMEPKYKKKKKYTEDESDLDDDWIAEWEDQLEKKEIEKAEKKFAKDNEKRVEEGEKELKPSELDGRIEEIKDEYARLRKERGTGKATLKRARPVEKVEEAIQKLDERIQTAKLQMVDREEGKEVALGTSKINYLDPRITASWCKEHDVPIEKIFSKTLLNKFPWAMEVDETWKF